MRLTNILLFASIVSLLLLSPTSGQGRRPQIIEQNFCNLMYADELAQAKLVDRLAFVQAYNVGQNGSLCITTCRVVSRGNLKPMEPMASPDFIPCSSGSNYCYKGNCTNEKELSELLKKNRLSKP